MRLSADLAANTEVSPDHLRTSPDGTRVSFLVTDGFGPAELWAAPSDGSAPAVLLSPSVFASTFTPDSSTVVFSSDRSPRA